jgi:D-sedoheptulose 7-phosphate isomerase
MNIEKSLHQIHSSMKEGAELRLQIAQVCGNNIVAAAEAMLQCLRSGGKLLFFGNGGSAADAQHLAAEFVGRFVKERRGLPAVALTTDSSILTAIGNDYGFDRVFSRQIEALGNPGDVAVGISSSGNSPNVIAAIRVATKQRLKTIALSGRDGGALAQCADISIVVASPNTARVQECHIAIGHLLCELVENEF